MSINALTSDGLRRARSRKTPRRPLRSHSRDAARGLALERLDLLALLAAGQTRAQPAVGLGLTHALAQHLVTDTEIARDRRDRPTQLERQPHTTLDQLLWRLPGSGHEPGVPSSRAKPSIQSLRETQGSSYGARPAIPSVTRRPSRQGHSCRPIAL